MKKTLLSILVLVLVLNACKKEEDPREAYVGTYDVEYTCEDNGEVDNYSHFCLVQIPTLYSPDEDNELTLSGFTGGTTTFTLTLSGDDFIGVAAGTGSIQGSFDGNRMVITNYNYLYQGDCDVPITAYKR